MILLSLLRILMRQISTGPHYVCNSHYSTSFAILCLITISLQSFRFLLILEVILCSLTLLRLFLTLMWPPFLLSALITLLSHFVCHMCLSLLPQVLNHFLIILKLIGLDYLSTFSIMTLIYCFMMMILFGSLSRTFSCPPFICTCGSDSFCCQLHTLV